MVLLPKQIGRRIVELRKLKDLSQEDLAKRVRIFILSLAQILKRYRTLNDDLDVLKEVLEIEPDERPPFSFRIDNLSMEPPLLK